MASLAVRIIEHCVFAYTCGFTDAFCATCFIHIPSLLCLGLYESRWNMKGFSSKMRSGCEKAARIKAAGEVKMTQSFVSLTRSHLVFTLNRAARKSWSPEVDFLSYVVAGMWDLWAKHSCSGSQNSVNITHCLWPADRKHNTCLQ